MDEIYLSSSIIDFNINKLLTQPLYYQQKAPVGFLFIVKIVVYLFGNKEMSLRLIPLIMGILSIFLSIPVSRYFLKGLASILAIGIICLAPAIIYHSVEIKQYSTEMCATLLCLYLYIHFKKRQKLLQLLTWGIIGAIIIWFSYSSIFILAGIALGVSLYRLLNKQWSLVLLGFIPFAIWFISFVINYLLFTHKHAESEWIAYWFRAYNNFMPLPPKSITDLKWFAVNIYRLMDYPLGLTWNSSEFKLDNLFGIIIKVPFIPILLLLAGIYFFLKERQEIFYIIISSLTLIFFASGLELYPLTERFWIFISPVFIILIAKGFQFFSLKFQSLVLSSVLFLLLVAPLLWQSFFYLKNPNQFYSHKKSFQREVLMFVNKNFRSGDAVYIYWNNKPGYQIYKKMYELKYTAVVGSDTRNHSVNLEQYNKNLQQDFKKFSSKKRVWLIYNTQFLTDIGDLIDQPTWYYKSNPSLNLKNQFLEKYYADKKIETKDISAQLFIKRK
ncbi:hypothetical protein [Pedobacter sp.]|uniref:hypothetical protein n=1 Tax=Pedobacter sp. TaxID=1411316 RepID=UPI003BAB465F